MNRWATKGNQIRGSGAACHYNDFNSAFRGASTVVGQHAEEGHHYLEI